jgi:hypothetical protein
LTWRIRQARSRPATLKDVANPTHGLDQFLTRAFVNFSAKAANMDVYRVAASIEMNVPNLLRNRRSRQDFAPAPSE